ncbi:protein IQ-DOMAIN 14-like [Senna tora]|uniref:Protein IQ-DOMAIN 14-like n=1 Tax=Senna tora TaxID=362788 RepID=A0A834T9V1_9FABA|nr:protein IQ-DOMAIN 14-like [Senna tora]
MGKASKWIRKFLIGKKEEKYKQIERGGSEMALGSPKVRRKWSFGKKTGKVAVADQKYSTSYDLTESAKLQIRAILAPHNLPPTPYFSQIQHAAATKIQAAFRSYLGRRALHALRGLVKLQALVRGHLVRKQTTTTLRSMHALMSIQVRARIHRIQMAQEPNLLPKHSSQSQIRQYKDSKDTSVREMLQVLRSRSGPLDGRKSVEPDSMMTERQSSKNVWVSISKRQGGYSAPNSPDEQVVVSARKALSNSLRHQQSWEREPNYMTNTESSRAKARSESEPKQRPTRSIRQSDINKHIELESLDGGSRSEPSITYEIHPIANLALNSSNPSKASALCWYDDVSKCRRRQSEEVRLDAPAVAF